MERTKYKNKIFGWKYTWYTLKIRITKNSFSDKLTLQNSNNNITNFDKMGLFPFTTWIPNDSAFLIKWSNDLTNSGIWPFPNYNIGFSYITRKIMASAILSKASFNVWYDLSPMWIPRQKNNKIIFSIFFLVFSELENSRIRNYLNPLVALSVFPQSG